MRIKLAVALFIVSLSAQAFKPPSLVPDRDIALLKEGCKIKNDNPSMSNESLKNSIMSMEVGISEKQAERVVNMLSLLPEISKPGFNCDEVDIIYNNKNLK
ncbi:hypothetical protein N5923_03555 [Erwiniaceae bacterium BAC15a-03b]|uniref:Uncharacterized protein n=1 Tax=Winslowiella arboricola TaxID=2978220 RepID=A0A9J6PE68_9GAMM|nr:hypothetical protein [Winslowiella arboricola]MCU5773511.1 hypothetical protein [Winslowiella arboricola]MCU5776577.1 hypothetical protein [Winslowiella arboricola]